MGIYIIPSTTNKIAIYLFLWLNNDLEVVRHRLGGLCANAWRHRAWLWVPTILHKMDSTGKLGGEFQQGLPECAIKFVRMRKVAF